MREKVLVRGRTRRNKTPVEMDAVLARQLALRGKLEIVGEDTLLTQMQRKVIEPQIQPVQMERKDGDEEPETPGSGSDTPEQSPPSDEPQSPLAEDEAAGDAENDDSVSESMEDERIGKVAKRRGEPAPKPTKRRS